MVVIKHLSCSSRMSSDIIREGGYGREERWVGKRSISVCESSKRVQGLWDLYPWSTGLKVTELIRATCDMKPQLWFWGALLIYIDKMAIHILRLQKGLELWGKIQWIFWALSLNCFYLLQIPIWFLISRRASRQVNAMCHHLLQNHV